MNDTTKSTQICNGYHVDTRSLEYGFGLLGVAADSKTEAKAIARERLKSDGATSIEIGHVESIGRVSWDHGSTILYRTER